MYVGKTKTHPDTFFLSNSKVIKISSLSRQLRSLKQTRALKYLRVDTFTVWFEFPNEFTTSLASNQQNLIDSIDHNVTPELFIFCQKIDYTLWLRSIICCLISAFSHTIQETINKQLNL